MDIEFTPTPVCPYCGQPYDAWWEHRDLKSDGDVSEWACGRCGLDFHVQLHMSVSFTTKNLQQVLEKEIEKLESWLELAEKHPDDLRPRFVPGGFDVVLAEKRLKLAQARQKLSWFIEQKREETDEEVVAEAQEDLDGGRQDP